VPAHTPSPGFEERAALFSAKVRQRRHELGLSERQLMDRTGLSRGYIQLLLNTRGSHKDDAGEYRLPNPTLDVIWVLAQALDTDITYLVDPDRPIEQQRP